MMGLAQAISASLSSEGQLQDYAFTRGEPPGRTDRSSSVPLSQAMTMADDPVIVQSGFKTRPLREGVGNNPRTTSSTAGDPGIHHSAPGNVLCTGGPAVYQQRGSQMHSVTSCFPGQDMR
jgi:hypothetical protein